MAKATPIQPGIIPKKGTPDLQQKEVQQTKTQQAKKMTSADAA